MRTYLRVGIVGLLALGAVACSSANTEKAQAEADSSGFITCPEMPEPKHEIVCAAVYQPVCADASVGAGLQTFSNSCKACATSGVSRYTDGACE